MLAAFDILCMSQGAGQGESNSGAAAKLAKGGERKSRRERARRDRRTDSTCMIWVGWGWHEVEGGKKRQGRKGLVNGGCMREREAKTAQGDHV